MERLLLQALEGDFDVGPVLLGGRLGSGANGVGATQRRIDRVRQAGTAFAVPAADRLGQAVSVADEPYQRDQVAGFLAVDVVLGVRSASGGEVQREQMRLAVAKHQSNTAGFDILADEVPQLR